jgi:hypothetical protein
MENFDRAKATALFKSGLGKAEGEFIASIVTPIYGTIKQVAVSQLGMVRYSF